MMYEIKGAIYWCTRLRMLEWLNNKGFKPLGTTIDRRNPKMTTWLFRATPELVSAVNEYFASRSA